MEFNYTGQLGYPEVTDICVCVCVCIYILYTYIYISRILTYT
jgi:hypothetical protein